MCTVTAYAVEERLYDHLNEAAAELPIDEAIAHVANMRVARLEPVALIDALERYRADAELGLVPML